MHYLQFVIFTTYNEGRKGGYKSMNDIYKIKDRLNQILSENTGKELSVIQNDTERDNFMTAEEAREYGLIDKVITKR